MLVALGFAAHERVSINTRAPGGRFQSRLWRVADLDGWEPPQDRDVWFGVNPVARHVRSGRGTEGDIRRVRALFADLDVKPGRQFDAIDKCYDAARMLGNRLGVAPAALVESGHGLQPIWRVGSPSGDSNVVDRDRSRDDWKLLYARWGSLVQRAARDAMWSPDGAQNSRSIDNVYNLDRILRCPGSVNWKNADDPVPVKAWLVESPGRMRAAGLLNVLDGSSVGPLAPVRSVGARVATNLGEADAWIGEQPGADLEPADLRQRPRGQVLWQYLDAAALVDVLDDPNGAHQAMTAKVLHAVLSAQEGRAGLVVALNNLSDAYVALMEARARGDRAGDVRSVATAEDDVRRAVVGAVARARARGKPVIPNVEAWGPGRATVMPVRRTRRSWPRYRPQSRPRARRQGHER
ncbi:hypothetical protein KXD97_28245 [Mycobacterium sp. SMC-8]|uniref:hypothetical protein n=1 Tax=Mycobacterium sp. SMC-8 TaxID=2857060 RepID=UPI0021B1C731|nr:hypothetical protein [Mycobacterium sp. SMC-8]UXA11807.1 hypothetical protein KXD97_28245 [Mycobacterium sp. SMC-8]